MLSGHYGTNANRVKWKSEKLSQKRMTLKRYIKRKQSTAPCFYCCAPSCPAQDTHGRRSCQWDERVYISYAIVSISIRTRFVFIINHSPLEDHQFRRLTLSRRTIDVISCRSVLPCRWKCCLCERRKEINVIRLINITAGHTCIEII